MLAPPWCAPVYARMRGIRRSHRKSARARQARPRARGARSPRELRERGLRARDRAAELVEVGARAVARAHPAAHRLRGRVRYGLLNDRATARSQGAAAARRSLRRAGGAAAARWCRCRPRRCSCRISRIATRPCARCVCRPTGPIVDPVPRRRVRPGQALAAEALRRTRRAASSRDGLQVWLVGSPNDKLAADVGAAGRAAMQRARVRDLTGRTDLGTAIDLLSLGVGRRVATIPGSCTRRRRSACRWSRCSARRRRSTRRRCRRSRRSRRSTSRAARASSANARSATSSACASSSRRCGLQSRARRCLRTSRPTAPLLNERRHGQGPHAADLHLAAGRGARVLPGVRGARTSTR